ncbi:hypothetical protein [Pedobacter jeongneungensis]|nr:hypothetical protein [Pedobacter jeongneungensis]
MSVRDGSGIPQHSEELERKARAEGNGQVEKGKRNTAMPYTV